VSPLRAAPHSKKPAPSAFTDKQRSKTGSYC
jgi:hypothetical protein